MEKIEIIGIAVGIAATILAGIGFSISQIFKLGKNLGEYGTRFDSMEKSIDEMESTLKESIKRTDDKLDQLPCAAHSEELIKSSTILDSMKKSLEKLPCAAHSEELIKSSTILDSMKKSLEKLPCDTHSEELIKSRTILDSVAKTVDKLEKATDELKASIKYLPCASHGSSIGKIQTFLIQKYPAAAVALGAKASPRRLNEQGLKVFADIDGDSFLKEHKEHLFGYITQNDPLTELDVEQLAFAACQSLTITPVFNKLKRYVYNASPIELSDGKKYELDLSDICFTLSIPLRDMYLSEIGIKEETG